MLNIKKNPATVEFSNPLNMAQVEILKATITMLDAVSTAKCKFARNLVDKAIELGFAYDADEIYENVFAVVGGMAYDDIEDIIEKAEDYYAEAVAYRNRAANYLPEGDKMLEILNQQAVIAEEALDVVKEATDYLIYIGDAELEAKYVEALMADKVEMLTECADEVHKSVVESVKSIIPF